MKLATTTADLFTYDIPQQEIIRTYQGTGFRYLDYNFSERAKNDPYLLDDDYLWRQELNTCAETAAECGFQFVQAHAPSYNPFAECNHEAMLRFMIRSIEGCGILGIPNLVIHTGYTQQLQYPQDREGYFRFNRKYVEKLLPAAEKHNVTICVENSTVKNMCGAYFFMTPEELNSFVEFVNHPLVGVCWDTGHAVLEGKSDQYDDILALGKNLKAVHIHDNRNDQDFHQPPFSGVLQLDRLLQGLLDISFAGPFTFESCFFLGACYGDYFRHASPTDAPLAQLPLELRRESIALLYKIGKHILNTYNCFEE